MGAIYTNVIIRNPADNNKSWEGRFLVDTGATESLVPAPCLEAIGLKPISQREYELADGSKIELGIAPGVIEFMGEIVGTTIVFGAADAEPLLGVTALESAAVEVDPRNQKLKKLPGGKLKRKRKSLPLAA